MDVSASSSCCCCLGYRRGLVGKKRKKKKPGGGVSVLRLRARSDGRVDSVEFLWSSKIRRRELRTCSIGRDSKSHAGCGRNVKLNAAHGLMENNNVGARLWAGRLLAPALLQKKKLPQSGFTRTSRKLSYMRILGMKALSGKTDRTPTVVPCDEGFPAPVAASATTTYISPEASELTKRRPCLSKVMPTGQKQAPGHFEISALVKMSVYDVVLVEGATGSPLAKSTREIL